MVIVLGLEVERNSLKRGEGEEKSLQMQAKSKVHIPSVVKIGRLGEAGLVCRLDLSSP